MSRCFPFPPPGCVKKARTVEVDLLQKEKQSENKHIKEKRDKEKRESKEKRVKEARDGKHKEKKDKKKKHREKKKDKDEDKKDKGRARDKSKTGAADDKGLPGQAESPNAGKLHQKEIKKNDKGSLFEEKPTKQYTVNNGEKARQNNHLAQENKDSKFLLELDRRIKDGNGGVSNQLVQCTNTAHRKDEGTARFVAKDSGTWPDGKDKVFDANKIDGKGIWADARPFANATVKNHARNFHPRVDGMPGILEKNSALDAGNFHPRVDGTPRTLENNFNRTLEAKVERKEKFGEKKDEAQENIRENKDEGKGKIKEKKDDKEGDRRKDKEKEKGHGKDKDRDKEKKKEEKAMGHAEIKTIELNKLKESNKAGPVGLNSFSHGSKNNHENAVGGENPKKRKDIESNGVQPANDNWPGKLPRPSSFHPLSESGKIWEPCQISISIASDKSGGIPCVEVEKKDYKRNGVIDSRPFAVSSNKTHTVIMPADPVTKASTKLPHLDTKLLNQVYSVPKMEEWSGFDDQEWLFDGSVSKERKPMVGCSEAGESLQVWAEGLHIEPADVFALPYVIPY